MAEKRVPSVAYIFENCLGCKWTLLVLDRIRAGVKRPGRLEKAIPGITTKVLSERLEKLQRFGLIEKKIFPEIPPRVEYGLTSFGKRLSRILDSVEKLRGDVARGRV
jgi:DNA-binding HxlR family transcriptional regulator